MNMNQKREKGEEARQNNIRASTTVADIIRSTIGPRSMLKMILDPVGGIVMTNDGNAILREIDVAHPAAKAMIELARSQYELCGDGSSSAIVIAGEVLAASQALLSKKIHPVVITAAYQKALEYLLKYAKELSYKIDTENDEQIMKILDNAVNTTFSNRFGDLICKLALKAVKIVARCKNENPESQLDIKRLIRIEKIPGGDVQDSEVIEGVVLNKEAVSCEMRRVVKNPRIVLLDCPLEYKKANSQLNIQLGANADLSDILDVERKYISGLVDHIVQTCKPDIVVTTKGISDLAAQLFQNYNVTAFRRAKTTDINRLNKVTHAAVVNRLDDLQPHHVGYAELFELKQIGDEWFAYIMNPGKAEAATITLRGASKDFLLEIERNLNLAITVTSRLFDTPLVVTGGGAFELELARRLQNEKTDSEAEKLLFSEIAQGLLSIPSILLQNCGSNVINQLTKLKALHAQGQQNMGVNGETGELCDLKDGDYKIADLYSCNQLSLYVNKSR